MLTVVYFFGNQNATVQFKVACNCNIKFVQMQPKRYATGNFGIFFLLQKDKKKKKEEGGKERRYGKKKATYLIIVTCKDFACCRYNEQCLYIQKYRVLGEHATTTSVNND